MNLLRYIKGLRRGKEAHRIELEAMKDFFLSEALEGYDAVDDNHLKRISRLQKRINNHGRKENKTAIVKSILKHTSINPAVNNRWKNWSIAALLLLCLSLSAYYFWKNYEPFTENPFAALPKSQEEPEALEAEKDTVNLRRDTLIIYMPKPPRPRNNLGFDSSKVERKIEIIKLDASQMQLPTVAAPQSNANQSLDDVVKTTIIDVKTKLK